MKIKVVLDDTNFLNFSDNFYSPEFIPLETTDSNLFREISNLKVKNDKLCVFSEKPDNMVSMYDLTGKYLNRIYSIGRGPGEVNSSTSFDVDTCISILDRGNRKLVNYSFSGKYISEVSFNSIYFYSFSFLNDGLMVFHDYHSPENKNGDNVPKTKLTFWKYDQNKKMKLIHNAKDLNAGKYIRMTLKNFYTFNKNKLYYWDSFNDSILGIDLKTFDNELQYVLDFGKYRIPDDVSENEFKKEAPAKRFMKVIKKGYASLFDYYNCGTGKQIFIICRYSKFSIGIMKDKETDLKCFPLICLDNIHPKLKANMSSGNFVLVHYDNNQSLIYFEWKALDFLKTFESLKNQLNATEWESLLNSNPILKNVLAKVKPGDNPIIMKAKLKEI
ncbi:MAG: 6-bladed beta-propeller [Clostridia bacterium]